MEPNTPKPPEEGQSAVLRSGDLFGGPTLRRAGKTYDDQPIYEVLSGENVIGRIEGHNPTFERSSPGKRYVNARWKSRRRYWWAKDANHRTIARAVETLKRALRYFVPNDGHQPRSPERTQTK